MVSQRTVDPPPSGIPRSSRGRPTRLKFIGPSGSVYQNSKKQGDAGLGVAIGYFAERGYTVCVPLTDSQAYDLVVEDADSNLQRVQVKTTAFRKPSGNWEVNLRVKGGNKSGTGKTKKFDVSKVDYIFVVTGDRALYLIPSSCVGINSVTLSAALETYRLDRGNS